MLSRLLADELRLIEALQEKAPLAVRRWEQEAALGTRDPVCGMPLLSECDRSGAEYQGRSYSFCHEECRRRFLRKPELYLAAAEGSAGL